MSPVLLVLIGILHMAEFAAIYYDGGGRYNYDFDGVGNYNYKFELEDQQRQELRIGNIPDPERKEHYYIVQGEYSFYDGEKWYRVTYTADANGYRPHTEILSAGGFTPTTPRPPQAPPLPISPPVPPINKHALETIGGSRSGR